MYLFSKIKYEIMKRVLLILVLIQLGYLLPADAQVCNPANPPVNLISTYSPGLGALLQWDAIPGSIGVQIKATSPMGANVSRRIVGFERSQFVVPDALLEPGTYTWQVQAACSTVPPYNVTPISASDNFVVGGTTCPASVTDVNGNSYQTILVGSQCWMRENLKTENYRNGNPIPTSLTNLEWQTTIAGAFAAYDNSASNKSTYGLLYNWHAVVDSRSICPDGWHIPSDDEWTTLTDELGEFFVSGGKMKSTGNLSAGTGLWQAPNTDATNSSGFSGHPGGFKALSGGYNLIGYNGYWWSSSHAFSTNAWIRELSYSFGSTTRSSGSKQIGYSVRCLKD